MATTTDTLEYTLPQIAALLEQPFWRVQYVVRSRRIAPARRVGNARVFDLAGLNEITEALVETARSNCNRKKNGGNGGNGKHAKDSGVVKTTAESSAGAGGRPRKARARKTAATG